MRIESLELIHHRLAFKNEFKHAKKARTYGDNILVKITTSNALIGFGEILPRPYVTGECIEGIMQCGNETADATDNSDLAATLVASVLGQTFSNQLALSYWLDSQLGQYTSAPALFGGVELALWNALAQEIAVDFDTLLGPSRHRPTGNCVTLGFDADIDQLRARAIHARLQKATVVKLKVGLDDDVDRIQELNKQFKGLMPIRVDANACYSADQLERFLVGAKGTALQSVEEPLDLSFRSSASSAGHPTDTLKTLYREHQIPFIADESVCTLDDAHELIANGGVHGFNLRVGKHGGLQASRQIRDIALAANISLVAGSMVGETGVLTQASQLLLHRTDCLDYVEGLGQNLSFLAVDPVVPRPSAGSSRNSKKQASSGLSMGEMHAFDYDQAALHDSIVSVRQFGLSSTSRSSVG